MNKVILLGRVTRDPEVRYSQSATPVAVARYGLAVRRQFSRQGDPDVDFFNIVAFGKAAEFAEKYFRKGQMIAIEGRAQVNTWEDAQKVKKTSVDIIVEGQHFAEGKQEQGKQPQEDAFAQQPQDDDDLPF
jgi:single-strand DNA-binding protein